MTHRIIHLRRKQIGAVVAQAVLGLILLKRQRHDGVHTEVSEVLDPIHDIQEFTDPMRPNVLALIILGVKHTKVKLINDQITECRRTESFVVPGKRIRIADNTVALRIAIHLQFTCIRISLETFSSRSHDIEPILIAILDPREEPAPISAHVLHQ